MINLLRLRKYESNFKNTFFRTMLTRSRIKEAVRRVQINKRKALTAKPASHKRSKSVGMENIECKSNIISANIVELPSPIKSDNDKKEYAVFKLSNGLTVLLISDVHNLVNIGDTATKKTLSDNEVSGTESESDGCCENNGNTREEPLSDSELSGTEPESDRCSENDVTAAGVPHSDNELSDTESESDKSSKNDEKGKQTCKNPDEKLAACALTVGVGSFSDPEDVPGLAHFLEHMVFMGSEKYPKENEFDAFLKKKGGSNNASTECEYTTFYFDCQEIHLLKAMDIFAQFFISPLMKKETMTREREAIESEFQISLQSDAYRKQQILCGTAHNNNPARKFMWGNLITLRDNVVDDKLHESAHEFWARHYSAHRMTLAIQARLPMETLKEWVVSCFSSVPTNNLPPEEVIQTDPPFQKHKFCQIYNIMPVNNICSVELNWILPPVQHLYHSKPLEYLSWLIGYEGKGSLISYLRKKLWALDITAGYGDDGTESNQIYTLFCVKMELTNAGMNSLPELLNSVFSYLKCIKINGPEESLFKEIQLIDETNFKFSQEIEPSENVELLSQNMQLYPPEEFITGPELLFEYRPDFITLFLDALTPEDVNITIHSYEEANKVCLDQTEPWFGTKYNVSQIPTQWIKTWLSITPYAAFALPGPNQFITTDFSLLPLPIKVEDYPKIIEHNRAMELWYKQDTKFRLPFGYICLHLISPLPHQSPLNAAFLDIYINCLKHLLIEEMYPVLMARLSYEIVAGEKGIVIAVSGFNEKLSLVLGTIMRCMAEFNGVISAGIFDVLREEQSKRYYNNSLKATFVAKQVRMSLLLQTYWTSSDKFQALPSITLERLKDFILQYQEHLYVQCLVQGNISREVASNVCKSVCESLQCKPILTNTLLHMRVCRIPEGEKFCRVKSFNRSDTNCIVTNYYQCGLGTIKDNCILDIIIMAMEEPLFDSLRTKEQLGYDIFCTLRDTFGILGFSITVNSQSDKHSIEHVEKRMSQFFEKFNKTFKKTYKNDFETIQQSLISLKQCADIDLQCEVQRNWDEIKSHEYLFDRISKEVQCIKELTLPEVQTFLDTHFKFGKGSTSRKLSVQILGRSDSDRDELSKSVSFEKDKGDAKLIDLKLQIITDPENEFPNSFISDIDTYKQGLMIYPVHKINK